MRGSATLSDCGRYRYLLSRHFDQSDLLQDGNDFCDSLVFVMLNPSTADALVDDPTIKRCIGFAKSFGFDTMHVLNLFAGRTPHPDELFEMEDPDGPENYSFWLELMDSNAKIVCAWGADRRAENQAGEFLQLMDMGGHELFCLGRSKSGAPRHPLYLRKDSQLERFVGAAGW